MRRTAPLLFTTLLGLGALTACGSDVVDAVSEGKKAAENAIESDGAQEQTGDEGGALAPVEFLLPETVSVPGGSNEILTECADPAPAEGEYRSNYGFAVPSGWTPNARSAAGSGTLLDEDIKLGFDTAKGDVDVALERDQLNEDGVVLGPDREPFTSFDRSYTVVSSSGPDVEVSIVFDDLGTFTVGDQTVSLFVAPKAQHPDQMYATEYKARVETMSVPAPNLNRSNAHTKSIVVTVSHEDDGAVTEDDVKSIIGSLALAPCVRESVFDDLELTYQEDLDGDGKITTVEEMLAKLSED